MKLFITYILLLTLVACQPAREIQFGIISDVHKDIVWDADARLQAFIDTMNHVQPDFIIQLGDFCRPYAENRQFMRIWNSFSGEKHHVLGNHDMDGGFSRDSTAAFFGSPSRYYSFDRQGFHFVVLDANDINPSPDRAPGYPHYLGLEQLTWLKHDLLATRIPTLIFSHQPLHSGLENSQEVMALLEEYNRSSVAGVIACFNGHDHANRFDRINGIWYIHINSASYEWLGEQWKHRSYPDSIHEKHPWMDYTAPYKEALWALVSVNSNGEILITGRSTGWVGLSPEELGHPGKGGGHRFDTSISDTLLTFTKSNKR